MAQLNHTARRHGLLSTIANVGRMVSAGLAQLAEQRTQACSYGSCQPLGEDLSSRMPAYEPLPAPAATPLTHAKPANSTRAAGQISHNVAG